MAVVTAARRASESVLLMWRTWVCAELGCGGVGGIGTVIGLAAGPQALAVHKPMIKISRFI